MKRMLTMLLCLVLLCMAAMPVCADEIEMRAEDFWGNFGTDAYGDPITEIQDEMSLEYLLIGEQFWVQFSETLRQEIDALFLEMNQRTYTDLLAEAKEWEALEKESEGKTGELKSVTEFLKHCATDQQGVRITKVTVDNVAHIIVGQTIWEELTFRWKMQVNVELKRRGQPAYQDLIAEADVLLTDMMMNPDKYTTTAVPAVTTTVPTTTQTAAATTTKKAVVTNTTKETRSTAVSTTTAKDTTVMTTVETTVKSAGSTTGTTAVAVGGESGGFPLGAVIAVAGGVMLIAAGVVTAVIVRKRLWGKQEVF